MYMMNNLCCVFIGFILLIPLAWADKQEKLVTLEEASHAAGLNAGAQQRLLRNGIDVSQLALGITESYRAKPDDKRVEIARKSSSVFPIPTDKKSTADKNTLLQASFDLGILVAMENQEQLKTIDIHAFIEGFKKSYTKSIASPQLASASLVISHYSQQQRMKDADDNLAKSTEFLAENAKHKGVVVTQSGLQYEVLEEGNGPKPTVMDMVSVNYRHSKPNSDFLYDSAEHGHSETMAMRGVIPAGWKELFLLMNKGSRYRVYLPPALGFGAEGNGDALMPNEVLITEFTLLDIIPPPAVAY